MPRGPFGEVPVPRVLVETSNLYALNSMAGRSRDYGPGLSGHRPDEPVAHPQLSLKELEAIKEEADALFNRLKESKENFQQSMNPTLRLAQAEQGQVRRPEVQVTPVPILSGPPDPQSPRVQPRAPAPPPQKTRRNNKGNTQNAQKPKQSSRSSKMDVWDLVQRFYARLPSKAEIEDIFSILDKARRSVVPQQPMQHWSVRVKKLVRDTGLAPPPRPPPSRDALGDFWRDRDTTFEMENVQKRNWSVLHSLSNSFVEIGECSADEHRKVLYLKEQPLLPIMEYDTYLAHDFETRLNLELESLGLNNPEPGQYDDSVPFESNIRGSMERIEANMRVLAALRQEIMSKSDEFRNREVIDKQRFREAQAFIDEYRAKNKSTKK